MVVVRGQEALRRTAWSNAEPVSKSMSRVDFIPRSSNEGDTMARSSTVRSSPLLKQVREVEYAT